MKMNIDNTINYWLDVKKLEEAKGKVITGNFKESTEKDLKILENLNIQKEDRVLDFGCGIGRLTQPVSNICKEIIGVDVSEEMIGHAVKYCKNKNISFKPLNNEEGYRMPLNCVDKAFSFIVIQHIEKPKAFKVLFNIFKSLKIGGQMMIQFPSLENNENMYKAVISRNINRLDPRMEFYTRTELKYIFELLRMDYQILEIETDYYVLATKKEDFDMDEYLILTNS